MSRADLGNGRWAELREPDDVTERQRRPISRALRPVRPEIMQRQQDAANLPNEPDGKPSPEKAKALAQLQYDMTDDEADAYQNATDHAVLALVESWSFEHPLTMEGLLDLPGKALDALRMEVSQLVNDLFLDISPSPEKNGPFGSSNGSATSSSAAPKTSSPTSGAPIASSSSAFPFER